MAFNIPDIIISTLINGSTYAMLAIGFSLIFGVARIVNIAHTAFFMVAAYGIYFANYRLGLGSISAMIFAISIVTLLGWVAYVLFIKPIREHEQAVLIGTIALAMALEEIMLMIFSGDFLTVPALIKGYTSIIGVKVFYQQILTFVSVLAVLGLMRIFLFHTKLGLAVRATAQDREVANLMGMDESRVAMMAVVISVGLAGVTGAVIVPLSTIEPYMWRHPLIMMMAVVVLGGMGSIRGSFYAAYILAFAEALIVFLVPAGSYLKGAVALSIMIIVLLVRPAGLFGVQFEEEG